MNPRLQISPTVCHGKSMVRVTRVLVSTVSAALSPGSSFAPARENEPVIFTKHIAPTLDLPKRPNWRSVNP